MNEIRTLICEAASDGLTPELAANMLLEPSRWKEKLFDPSRDLQTVYKQYLRGELGVGVLADAVQSVLISSNDMADLTDTVVQTYGTDATPEDVPEEAEVDAYPGDEQVEVLVPVDRGADLVKIMVDHIQTRWSPELLEALYGSDLVEAGPVQNLSPEQIATARAQHGSTIEPSPQKPQPKPRFRPQPQQMKPEMLKSFEQGRFFGNAADSLSSITKLRQHVAELYQAQQWAELANIYRSGGSLDLNLAALGGDMMVLKDIVDSAVNSGYQNRKISGVQALPVAGIYGEAQEAWVPALLDPELGNELTELSNMLGTAAQKEITYGQLQELIAPFARAGSQLFNWARREQKGGQSSPFTYDQKFANQKVQATSAVANAAGPSAGVAAAEPMHTAKDVLQMLSDEAGAEVVAPGEPEVAMAPETPEQKAKQAVTQAVDPDDLSSILQPGEGVDPVAVATKTYGEIMGLKPDRAAALAKFMQKKGMEPDILGKNLRDTFAVLQQLQLTPGGWRSWAQKNPEIARSTQQEIQKYVKQRLAAGKEPVAHAMIRIATQQLSSI